MCTNFAFIKKNGTAELANRLGVDSDQFLYSNDIRPGSTISIVAESSEIRQVVPAIWWLYLQQTEAGLKPHKDYFSVNTNYKKLASKQEYRKSRCIIPATAFTESQHGKHPHLLEPCDGSAIAFGGLYKKWIDKTSGDMVFSASIITLAGHPSLKSIHEKSIPLMIPQDDYDLWLDPTMTETEVFQELLQPHLLCDMFATPIDKASSKKTIGGKLKISV